MKKLLLILTLATPVLAETPRQSNKQKLIKGLAYIIRDAAIGTVAGGIMGLIMNNNQNLGHHNPFAFGNARPNPVANFAKWGALLGALLGVGECANEFVG